MDEFLGEIGTLAATLDDDFAKELGKPVGDDVAKTDLAESSCIGGARATGKTGVPSSSRDAMVLNGSPRAKAHGAVALVGVTENHSALRVDASPRARQPPMMTFSPSASASMRKTSPRSAAWSSQGIMWFDLSSSERNFIILVRDQNNRQDRVFDNLSTINRPKQQTGQLFWSLTRTSTR